MALLNDFIEDCEIRGLSKLTIKTYVLTIRDFKRARKIGFKDVSRDDVIQYILLMRKRHLAHSTMNGRLAALGALFEFMQENNLIDQNPIANVKKRYLHSYKTTSGRRKIISIAEAAKLVNSILDTRDKAIIMLLFKTGLRRQELINIDIDDISFATNSIRLKSTPKRSNRIVFFDNEASESLEEWIKFRCPRNIKNSEALFISKQGNRIDGSTLQKMVVARAASVGLHKRGPIEDRFTPHCCRHWFTTHLRRAGMPREFIQELRGDKRKDAIDIYDHIDLQELRESYLAHIPKLC